MTRELTREEKKKIRALVVKWCANYDKEFVLTQMRMIPPGIT